jgi:hypothetical protein
MLLPKGLIFDQGLMNRVVFAIQNAKGKEIRGKDWIIILEDLKDCLNPYLSTFANTPLGHIRLWGGGGDCRETLETDLRGVAYNASNLALSTQGFWTEPRGGGNQKETDILHFWGITRKGDWILVKILAQMNVQGKDKDGKDFYRHKAVEVKHAQKSDLSEICKECKHTHANIFDSLYLAVFSWANRREELATQASRFHCGLQALHELIWDFMR